jgi:hypothetical protein
VASDFFKSPARVDKIKPKKSLTLLKQQEEGKSTDSFTFDKGEISITN